MYTIPFSIQYSSLMYTSTYNLIVYTVGQSDVDRKRKAFFISTQKKGQFLGDFHMKSSENLNESVNKIGKLNLRKV
jgi:hypothetical protein